MKQKEWRTPNRMKFESLHKTFNREADLIMTGNVSSRVQLSTHVRAYNDTECNDHKFEPGHLRNFDLNAFSTWLRANPGVRKAVEEYTKDKSAWLYAFYHTNGRKVVIHGFVLTTYDNKLVRKFYTNPSYKSHSVIDEATKYITDDESEAAE